MHLNVKCCKFFLLTCITFVSEPRYFFLCPLATSHELHYTRWERERRRKNSFTCEYSLITILFTWVSSSYTAIELLYTLTLARSERKFMSQSVKVTIQLWLQLLHSFISPSPMRSFIVNAFDCTIFAFVRYFFFSFLFLFFSHVRWVRLEDFSFFFFSFFFLFTLFASWQTGCEQSLAPVKSPCICCHLLVQSESTVTVTVTFFSLSIKETTSESPQVDK